LVCKLWKEVYDKCEEIRFRRLLANEEARKAMLLYIGYRCAESQLQIFYFELSIPDSQLRGFTTKIGVEISDYGKRILFCNPSSDTEGVTQEDLDNILEDIEKFLGTTLDFKIEDINFDGLVFGRSRKQKFEKKLFAMARMLNLDYFIRLVYGNDEWEESADDIFKMRMISSRYPDHFFEDESCHRIEFSDLESKLCNEENQKSLFAYLKRSSRIIPKLW